jgi:hypothetical protein
MRCGVERDGDADHEDDLSSGGQIRRAIQEKNHGKESSNNCVDSMRAWAAGSAARRWVGLRSRVEQVMVLDAKKSSSSCCCAELLPCGQALRRLYLRIVGSTRDPFTRNSLLNKKAFFVCPSDAVRLAPGVQGLLRMIGCWLLHTRAMSQQPELI